MRIFRKLRVLSLGKKIAKGIAAALLFVLVFLLSDKWGSQLYQWLEREHGQYVYQYATEGQFSENVYLSEETDRAFGVPGGLAGISAEESLSNLARDLMNQQWETAETLKKNEGYMTYLHEQGTGLTGLYAFCERIAGLQDSMVYACRYLLFLLWVVVLYFLMRCRPALYFSMGLLCIFATCVKLSGKFVAVFFFGASTYTPILTDGLLAPLLEAMLTFLIFDITIASLEKVRLGHKVEALYQDLPALQWLTVRLAGETEHEGWYRSDISRLLPHFSAYLTTGARTRKKAVRLMKAIESLCGPHTNRTFLEAAVEVQTLLPGR